MRYVTYQLNTRNKEERRKEIITLLETSPPPLQVRIGLGTYDELILDAWPGVQILRDPRRCLEYAIWFGYAE